MPKHKPIRCCFSLRTLSLLALLSCGFSQRTDGQCYYTWERIPNPAAGVTCYGVSINNLGAVAGRIESGGDTSTAFVWSPEMGRVQLPMVPGYVSMEATGINDLGHVAGDMWGPAGWAGFLWDGRDYTLIHHPAWANMIDVAGLNNWDQVVGTFTNSGTGPAHVFVWESGTMTDLGEPPGTRSPTVHGLNERGDLVGWSGTGPPPRFHAWRYQASQFEFLDAPAELPVTDARAISNGRVVVGRAADPSNYQWHAVVWNQSKTLAIPPPDPSSNAGFRGVNTAGRAAGYYEGNSNAAIAWQSGAIVNLRALVRPDLPFLRYGWSINDRGAILAQEHRGTVVLNPVWTTGDLTGDCHVSLEDLVILLSNFGCSPEQFPQGDVDGDGGVSLSDLTLLLAHWGE